MKLGRAPYPIFRNVVDFNSQQYSVKRPTTTKSRIGQEMESYSADHNEDLWVFDVSENNVKGISGELLEGSVGALARPTVDIQRDDRIDHGQDTYEVMEVINLPNEEDTEILLADLQRVQG